MSENGDNPSKKELKSIPVGKIQRASKVLGTGIKVGGNYLKYYAKKAFNSELSKDSLHEDNAEDIYNSLSEMKGSALKVAQMMSMDAQILPKAYQDKFAMAQYNAPALSFPLVSKTFVSQFGKTPLQLFDTFTKEAINAASIGQVHKATIKDEVFAVKVQYPGVADAIESDIKLLKPIAKKMLNMTTADMDVYLTEVQNKLIEETDYLLELERGTSISERCKDLEGLRFPKYYKDFSTNRILTMEFIDGEMLPEFLKKNPSNSVKNKIAQSMWDFFLFQMKELRMVHADPHPGNFMVDTNSNLVVLDFGCVKEIPEDFAANYFQLLRADIVSKTEELDGIYNRMGFFRPEDTEKEKAKLRLLYADMIKLLAIPFHSESFYFGDPIFFENIAKKGDDLMNDKEFRKMNNARGSEHAIYIIRTFYGLYTLLSQLNANVKLNYRLY
jgi:predicted unusual protein kinase regulating ubiquinone biosynthesis (AarF/ABC1/UbiB family)